MHDRRLLEPGVRVLSGLERPGHRHRLAPAGAAGDPPAPALVHKDDAAPDLGALAAAGDLFAPPSGAAETVSRVVPVAVQGPAFMAG